MFLLNLIEERLVDRLDYLREQAEQPDEYALWPKVTVVRRGDAHSASPPKMAMKKAEPAKPKAAPLPRTLIRHARS